MRIDAHQHFWDYDAHRDAWITNDMAVIQRDFAPRDLERELGANGFDGCVAVEADASVAQTRFLLGLARKHTFIKGVVGWVDLTDRFVGLTLEHLCQNAAFVGVRHGAQSEPDDYLTRDDVVRGIGALEQFGLTYDILIREHQLRAAVTLAARLPNQRFVLDHCAKPRIREHVMEPWASNIRALAQHPNVYCKVSGLVTEAEWRLWTGADLRPYLDVVFSAFGVERLMFGSDWPVCLVASPYDRVVRVLDDYVNALDDRDRAAVFGGNAERWYGLGHR